MSGSPSSLQRVPRVSEKKRPASTPEKKEVIDQFLDLVKKNKKAELERETTWDDIKRMESKYPYLSHLRGAYSSAFKEDLEVIEKGSGKSIEYVPPQKKPKKDDKGKDGEPMAVGEGGSGK